MEWRRGKLAKLPKDVRDKAAELEEELPDDLIVVRRDGDTLYWAVIGEHEWVAAKEKGMFDEWKELWVEGEIESKDGYLLSFQGTLAVKGRAIAIESPSIEGLIEDAMWRAYSLEREDVESLEFKIEEGRLFFKAKLSLTKEEVDAMRPYSLESYIYKRARWVGKDEG